MKIEIVIPFRDRGIDPRRQKNLDYVQAWWYTLGFDPKIVTDGLGKDDQFNRHRAYNLAVSRNPKADVFVFTEADMLIHPDQIAQAVEKAVETPGLVVPFTQYRYLSDSMTEVIRDDYLSGKHENITSFWTRKPGENSVFDLTPESVMDNGSSIGAVNVVSRETLQMTGGFTEATSGNWYDDNIIEEGFAHLTGQKTRWVDGPAVHLYHLPGWKGDHLTDADRIATQTNRRILLNMRRDIRVGRSDAVRSLMGFRS